MIEYFNKQIETTEPLTEESILFLSSCSMYTHWQVGDKMLYAILRAGSSVQMVPICERDIEKLKDEYAFLNMQDNIPCFIKVKNTSHV